MTSPVDVRVEYTVEATINVGNFQNVKPGYRISAAVPNGTHPSEVRAKLKALADSWMEEDIQDYRNESGQ